LYIFLSNLIWNAIKYNKQDWKIDIFYKSGELTIRDSWIWIEKSDLPKIFDRFFKWDKSRNTEWFGIGLSLVKKISDLYKWKIKFESEDWDGTKVKVKFS
jgi:signal transduction histidine kinase